MGKLFFLIFTTSLIIISVVLSTYNIELTTINLYVKSFEMPLSLLLLYSFVSGIITTVIYLIAIILSYKRKTREMKIALENNQEELDNLRRNPLRDGIE
tara:strand:- start:4490 stop:4786 length:297 start_codon:yes stop_codon:yes gene_type:complete